jgi:hypothetical protein
MEINMTGQAAVTLKLHFASDNNNVIPRIGRLYAPNNTLSQVAAAGFLDSYLSANGNDLLATDFVAAVASNGHQWYKPVFTAGSCQLTVLP